MQLLGTADPAAGRPCGIFWIVADEPIYLPLEQADIHADIVDLSAIVTVTQQFWQYSSGGLQRAKYVFPVPARAAVCGFEMSAEDGTVITAVSKEKEEAKREHAAAIASGQMTGLVEHVTDDAFLISLGALPAMQTITCQLTYVIDLLDDDVSDQVRLQISVSVGMRCGVLPAGIITARQTPPHRVAISADVYTTGAVKSITSPTHPDLTTDSDDGQQSAPRYAKYASTGFLSRDFVLSVVAEGLDAPRCVAQRTEEGHVAMQLALVPKFKLPPIPAQEYIFLVDRSGSMAGDRIETAKRGLMMLLRSLPAQGTTFNIFSFGRKCSGLWPQSMEYNEHTLGLATQHVDSMMPNFGGTEICSALEQTFRSRQHVVPTACFVLTDGESWDTQQTIDSVSLATRSASLEAPLRVFTLGIGNTTSTEMCEGIARAGNGICLMAVGPESIIGKCAKLVRAGRTYILRNVKIDWGIDSALENLNVVRQGPAQVDAIYPGNRLLVFNLIEGKDVRVPEEVVISAQRDGEGEVLRFTVPVQQVHDMSAGKSRHGTRLIHVLAARRIITDLEDNSKADVSPDAKVLITRLGIEYQLASRFTSFIAVDKRDMRPLTEQSEASVASPQDLSGPRLLMAYKNAAPVFGRATPLGEREGDRKRKRRRSVVVRNPASNALGDSLHHSPLLSMDEELFDMGESTSAAPPRPHGVSLFESSAEQSYSLSATFDVASPQALPDEDTLHSGLSKNPRKKKKKSIASPSSFISPPVPPPSCAFTPPASGAPHHPAIPAPGAPPARIRAFPAPRQSFGTPAASSSPDDRVADLVRLQSFDGSFAASESLGLIVGAEHLGQAAAQSVDEKVWATALAVAYLKLYMKGQPELLDGLVEKAIAFLEGVVDDVDGCLARAERLVAQS